MAAQAAIHAFRERGMVNQPNIIFSADDFGLSPAVNEAVERAHTHGALTQASLMIAAPAAADAIARAKNLPTLNTGLHLVLIDGESLLGHEKLPHITTPDGRFRRHQIALGVQYFASPAARRELAIEIEAQFAAYAATGLLLHHADAHKHMHLHPVVGRLMIRIGRRYGLKRLRIPAEPPATLKACGETLGLGDYALYAWSFLLRAQAGNLAATDYVFGLKWSGHMTEARVRTLLANLPAGTSEIYFHPATISDALLTRLMPGYEHEAEFAALLNLP